MRKLLFGLTIFLIVLVLNCSGFVFTTRALNDWRLHNFSEPFFRYPLPANSRLIQRETEIGLLVGNGNHCDFRATQVFVTTSTQEQVKEYYKDARFSPVGNDSFLTTDESLPVLLYFDRQTDTENKVQAVLIDVGYKPYFDFRCR